MKKKLSFLSTRVTVSFMLFGVLSKSSFSQDMSSMKRGAGEATLPSVVMPSPNAAVLTRTISENVDLYTGKTNIDVPLYSLKSKDIELPISVQANVNAPRLNEVASWIGLGWNLNAGGMITRVMKNLPDEFDGNISSTYNIHGTGYLNMKSAKNVNIEQGYRSQPTVPGSNEYTPGEMVDQCNRSSWNVGSSNKPSEAYDMEPDEFFFNFGKYSGKFVFNQDGQVVLLTEANLKFMPTISSGKLIAFTVVTDDGTTYQFNEYEESKLKTKTKSLAYMFRYTGMYINAPPIGVFGQHISQLSGNTSAPYYALWSNAKTYGYNSTPIVLGNLGNLYPASGQGWKYLSELQDFSNPDNIVEEEYCRYTSSWMLTRISSVSGGEINLTYSNVTLNYTADFTYNASVPELGNSCVVNCNWIFDWMYPAQPGTNASLANRTSLSQPKQILDKIYAYPTFGNYSYTKSSIEVYSKRLSAISTVDGFSVEFVANSSRLDLPGDKSLDYMTVSYNGSALRQFDFGHEYSYNGVASNFDSYSIPMNQIKLLYQGTAFIGYTGDPYTAVHTNDFSEDVRYRLFLTSITERGFDFETFQMPQLPPYRFEYSNKNSLPHRTSLEHDKFGFYAAGTEANPDMTKLMAGVLTKITYPTGGYKQFEFELNGMATSTVKMWNGLRVKKILEYESSTADPIVKTYTYGEFFPTDNPVTTYVMPDVAAQVTNISTGESRYVITGTKYFLSSSRINPEKSTRGGVGGYSWVEIRQPGNGSYRAEFSHNETTPGSDLDIGNYTFIVSRKLGGFMEEINKFGFVYPYPQFTSGDWKRGLLLHEYYKKEDGTMISSKHYDYDLTTFNEEKSSFGLRTTKYRIDLAADVIDWSWMLYGRYEYKARWQLLKQVKEWTYNATGTSYMEKVTDMAYSKQSYSGRNYLYLRQLTTDNSIKEKVVSVFKYPLDYQLNSFDFGIQWLKNKNVLNQPIENYSYTQDANGNNRRYLSGVINEYYHRDLFKPTLKAKYIYQPATSNTVFTESSFLNGVLQYDPAYRKVLNFENYDTRGNILQQNKVNDITESFIWDYNATYPVAKVSNAESREIAYTSFETFTPGGNWNYNQNGVVNAQNGVINGKSITGRKCYDLNYGMWINSTTQIPTIYTDRKYLLTLWAKGGTPGINVIHPDGSSEGIMFPYTVPKYTVGDWRYYEVEVQNANNIGLWKWGSEAATYIDEVRLFPANAQMTTYTYDPMVGVTSVCDPNNRITYYEYDWLKRLKLLRDAQGNVIKTYEYNYKQ